MIVESRDDVIIYFQPFIFPILLVNWIQRLTFEVAEADVISGTVPYFREIPLHWPCIDFKHVTSLQIQDLTRPSHLFLVGKSHFRWMLFSLMDDTVSYCSWISSTVWWIISISAFRCTKWIQMFDEIKHDDKFQFLTYNINCWRQIQHFPRTNPTFTSVTLDP